MLVCKLGIVLIMAQQMLARWVNPSQHDNQVYQWYPGEGNERPCKNPLWAGWGQKIDNIYIGRAWYDGYLLPAKVMPKHGRAYVGLHGKEYSNTTYEVLCGSRSHWEKASHGKIPRNAFIVGQAIDGGALYYGRANFMNGVHPGKIDQRTHGILIPYQGREHFLQSYEVLVTKKSRRSFEDEY